MASSNNEKLSFLKAENQELENTYEALLQEVHTLRQNLRTNEKIVSDLEIEKESLQEELKTYEKQKEKLKNHDNNKTIRELKSKIASLEITTQEKIDTGNAEIEQLKSQLAKQANNKTKTVQNEDDEFYRNALIEIQRDIQITNEEIEKYKALNENLLEELHKEKEISKNLEPKLEEMSSILESQEESNKSCLENLQALRERKKLLETEIAALKVAPADLDKRGNSLFAEVEDNCKYVQAQYQILKSEYAKCHAMLAKKTAELKTLKAKRVQLLSQMEKESEHTKAYSEMIESLKGTIQSLENTLEEYKKRPENPQIKTEGENLNWVHTIVENERNKVRGLREKMEQKSLERYVNGVNTFTTQLENLALKKQCLKDKAIIDDLQSKVEEKQMIVKELKLQIDGQKVVPSPNSEDKCKESEETVECVNEIDSQ